MPKKGDNMIVAVNSALEHSANASAVFNPRTDKAATVHGVYTRDYIETEGFSGFQPIFTCRTSDAASVAEQGVIELTSAMYGLTNKKFKITAKHNNGALVQLFLHKL